MLKKICIVLGIAAAGFAVACGGGGGQSQTCKDYIACWVKTGGMATTLETLYGPSGACWSDPAMTESCNTACKTANDRYQELGLAADAGCTFN